MPTVCWLSTVELRRIGVWRFAIIIALLQMIVGLLCGLMMTASTFAPASFAYFFQNIAPHLFPLQSSIMPSIFFMSLGVNPLGVPAVLIAPIVLAVISLIVGLFQGALIAWLYNAIAKKFRGFTLTLNFTSAQSPPQSKSSPNTRRSS